MLKRQMGIPLVEKDIIALFNVRAVKPTMHFKIDDRNLQKIIIRKSKRQMMKDMQKLLGTDNIVECVAEL